VRETRFREPTVSNAFSLVFVYDLARDPQAEHLGRGCLFQCPSNPICIPLPVAQRVGPSGTFAPRNRPAFEENFSFRLGSNQAHPGQRKRA